MHSIVSVPSTLNYAKALTSVSWVEKSCALVIMLHHGVPASALALADCSYLIRKCHHSLAIYIEMGSHCDSKEKIIQGRYSIPVNGFVLSLTLELVLECALQTLASEVTQGGGDHWLVGSDLFPPSCGSGLQPLPF